ncbi:MAG: M28 family peptidase [Bacteroidales bacterium]|nr:M28 family peptidase [Bacteroidales bacterium]
MKKLLLVLMALVFLFPVNGKTQNDDPFLLVFRLKSHLSFLASDSLEGRSLGSHGKIMAKNYIAEQFQSFGLQPYDDDYFQDFELRIQLVNILGTNVVGYLPGADPILKDEFIVIGAHYDHLGYFFRGDEKVIYNGADDNASGTAAVIELARYFSENREAIGRSIIFIAFDAEESGLIGAKRFINENTTFSTSDIRLMFSLDMVGMYSSHKKLDMRGSGSLAGGVKLFEGIASNQGIITGSTAADISQYTDTGPFGDAGIPSIHVFTGTRSPYHKPEDTWDLLDYEGMAEITKFLQELITELSQVPELKPSGQFAALQQPGAVRFDWGIVFNIGGSHQYYPDEFYRAKSVFAFSTGAFGQVHLGKRFTIQPEILYDNNGSQSPEGIFRRHEITTPLNLQYNPANESNEMVRAFPFIGPYYSYTFAGKNNLDGLNYDDLYDDQEWGVSMGIGMDIMKLQMAFTYRQGLTNISRSPDKEFYYKGLYFTMGYKF